MKAFSPIRYSLIAQAIVVALCSLLLLAIEPSYISSFVLGSSVFVLPNLYFTHYAFRYRSAAMSDWVFRSAIWGQMGKLALASIGFALVFKFATPKYIEVMFAGYITMIFTQCWLGQKIASAVAASAEETAPEEGSREPGS